MSAQTAPAPPKLSLSYKVYWGLASLGTSLISGIYGGLLTIFYQDYLGLNATWIGIAATIYAIWNAFNDPLFGYITDSTRSKKGAAYSLYALHGAFPGADLHPGLVCAAASWPTGTFLVDAGDHAAL